jgi:hypothetical protein
MGLVTDLLETWTVEAGDLRDRYALETAARICEAHVRELRSALLSVEDELLTVSQAAAESGYSAQHIRALVYERTLPNAGRKGRPRIRRGDLPKKPPRRKVLAGTVAGVGDKRRRGFDARQIIRRS